jgi:hypothetical protein
MKIPIKGQQLYVPGSLHISRGSDDVAGGLATISEVIISDHLPIEHHNSLMVKFEELDKATSYNYKNLLAKQDELSKTYAGKIAHPDPDINTPWIAEGDVVNGKVYKGKAIW